MAHVKHRYFLAHDRSEHGGDCSDLRAIWDGMGLPKKGHRYDGVSSWDPRFARVVVRNWFSEKLAHAMLDVFFT